MVEKRECCFVDPAVEKKRRYRVSKNLPDGITPHATPRKAARVAAKELALPYTDLREYQKKRTPPRNSIVVIYYDCEWVIGADHRGPIGWYIGQVSGDGKMVSSLIRNSIATPANAESDADDDSGGEQDSEGTAETGGIPVRECCISEGDRACEQHPRGGTWYVLYG